MKKWVFAVLLLLVIAGFIPLTKTTTLKINASFLNVYKQITSPANWLKWQSDLKSQSGNRAIKTDSSQIAINIKSPLINFNIEKKGLGDFYIVQSQGNQTYKYNCILIPENTTNKTIAVAAIKITAWSYFIELLSGNNAAELVIIQLKNYMEAPELYYGFPIRKELTPQKLIVVKRGAFLKNGVHDGLNKLLNDLNTFIAKNNLKAIYPLQLEYLPVENDTIKLILGLPVNKKAAVSNGIEYMTMPQGKILVGYLKGRYGDKEKLYDALRLYENDNYIHPMILPFERFKNNRLPVNDSTIVDMQVIVPYM